jgi:hypothetical protein
MDSCVVLFNSLFLFFCSFSTIFHSFCFPLFATRDSYVVSCGCPVPGPTGPSAAGLLASLALDLSHLADRFRGPAGQRVRLRTALHIGPVVVATVGGDRPKRELFCDANPTSFDSP